MLTEESFVDFKCPYCGDAVSFPGDCAGFAQACPNCTESVIVPEDGNATGRRLPLPVTTARLVLRRLQAGDWRDLMETLADEVMFRYADGRPLGEEEILRWLESDGHVKLTTPGQPFCLGLQLQGSDKLIGYLTLNFTDAQRLQAEFSMYVGRNHQRQGFATEAMAGLLEFCFAGIKLHRVTAACDSRHAAACRLFEKAGLRREGEFLQNHFADGGWQNTVCYAVLSQDYRKGNDAPPKGN